MLYPQYLDYPTGKVGVMSEPPRFVHFNGTIFTYRMFRDRKGQSVADELFRILLLSILEELIPAADGKHVVPTVEELARALEYPKQAVQYDKRCEPNYPEFRRQLESLLASPVFAGARGERMQQLIEPFDRQFKHEGGWMGEESEGRILASLGYRRSGPGQPNAGLCRAPPLQGDAC